MDHERRGEARRAAAFRGDDIVSYRALRWVVILLRSAAVFLIVAIFAECIAGLRAEGIAVLPFLLGELARAVIVSILLWAGSDLIRLLLQVGRDLHAERLLLARMVQRSERLGVDMAGVLPDQQLAPELLGEEDGSGGAVAPRGVGLEWGDGAAEGSISPRST